MSCFEGWSQAEDGQEQVWVGFDFPDGGGDLGVAGPAATEMGDPIDAIRQAAHVDDIRLPPELAERRASHLITVAWSHYLRRHDDDALSALTAAKAVAPEQLLFTHRVHDMVRQMLRRDRRGRRELRTLAKLVDVR
ncbi:MAG: hypothetical protein ACRDR6_18910 [Pseudonocardiaceae bacterium]